MFSSLQTALNWFFFILFYVWRKIEETFCSCSQSALLQLKHLVRRTQHSCWRILHGGAVTPQNDWIWLGEKKKMRLTREKAGTNRSGGGRLEKPGGLQDWKDQKEREGKKTVFNESSSVESRGRTGNDFWKCTCKHTIQAHSNCAYEDRNLKNDTPKEGPWDVVFVSEKWKE